MWRRTRSAAEAVPSMSGPHDMKDTRSSAEEEADRRELRVVEDDRADAQGKTPRNTQGGVGVYVRSGSVQLGAHEESAGEPSWNGVGPGRSVPARWENGKNGQ